MSTLPRREATYRTSQSIVPFDTLSEQGRCQCTRRTGRRTYSGLPSFHSHQCIVKRFPATNSSFNVRHAQSSAPRRLTHIATQCTQARSLITVRPKSACASPIARRGPRLSAHWAYAANSTSCIEAQRFPMRLHYMHTRFPMRAAYYAASLTHTYMCALHVVWQKKAWTVPKTTIMYMLDAVHHSGSQLRSCMAPMLSLRPQ